MNEIGNLMNSVIHFTAGMLMESKLLFSVCIFLRQARVECRSVWLAGEMELNSLRKSFNVY